MKGYEFVGGVDFGDGPSEHPATQALMFMVVALNGSFKLPIGHFFTDTAKAQGNTKHEKNNIFLKHTG